MFKKPRKTYAVYIKHKNLDRVTCHIRYCSDAGIAWLEMYDLIKKMNDEGKVFIVDVKRVD